MKQSHLALLSGLVLVVILAVSWCGRQPTPIHVASPTPTPAIAQSATPTASATPVATPTVSPSATQTPATPTPAPTQTPSENLQRATRKAGPAVIQISVFDSSGALLRNGIGFFVAKDGHLMTNWHVVDGGAHAVAKSSDGKIRNISGILASSPALDLAVLRAETTVGVPYLSLNKETEHPNNIPVALVGLSLTLHPEPLAATTISKRETGPDGDWFETSSSLPENADGAPVINEDGDVVGIVATGKKSDQTPAIVVRPASELEKLLTQAKQVSEARWAANASESPSPAGSVSPSPSPEENRRGKLVYTPAPVFPRQAMFEHLSGGSGRYRVIFNANGEPEAVQVVKSTGQAYLDQAAVEALRRWKAQPGHRWTLVVPMTFRTR